jgi:hypothetical protein
MTAAAPAGRAEGDETMAKFTFGVLVLAGLGLTAPMASAQTTTPEQPKGEINKRLENQKDRIQAGVKDDQLTKGETKRLVTEDKEIHAQEKADRAANDGHLTNGEKKQLNRELNSTSRQIYRARHNNRKPKS